MADAEHTLAELRARSPLPVWDAADVLAASEEAIAWLTHASGLANSPHRFIDYYKRMRSSLGGIQLRPAPLARIYLLVGEPEKALDQLEPLLKMPYYLSPGWLRIDPTFAPLKGNPRFERLIARPLSC
jgi:hypothetical protein